LDLGIFSRAGGGLHDAAFRGSRSVGCGLTRGVELGGADFDLGEF
jgi:hypothetical protein